MRTLLVMLTITACSIALADSVTIANGGKITGSITEVRLRIEDEQVSFARAKIKSVEFGEKATTIATANGWFSGKLDSVTIASSPGRVTSISGSSVRAIEFGTSDADPDGAPAIERSGEQGTLKLAGELRDDYLKKAGELTDQEYAAVKKKYADEWNAACLALDAAEKEYKRQTGRIAAERQEGVSGQGLGIGMSRGSNVKPIAGPIAEAHKKKQTAQAERDQIAQKIRLEQAVIKNRDHIRRDRVKNYYFAIARQIKDGNNITRDAMTKIYEKALDGAGEAEK